MKILKKFIDNVLTNEVLIALLLVVLALVIIVIPTYLKGKYADNNYIENIILEAHGMIFDLIIVGVFSTWLIKRGQKRQQIQNYRDEIDDFRNWKSEEAAHKILGSIKRLNKLGVTNMDLSHCFLCDIQLKGLDLREAEMYKINLSGSKLEQCNFEQASLTESDLSNSYFRWSNFKQSRLGYANLENSDLRDVDFSEADLYHANLKNANLRGANLHVVRNITAKQLSNTKTLYMAKMDALLKNEIKRKYPQLLERPVD